MAGPQLLTGKFYTTDDYHYEVALKGSDLMVVNLHIHPTVCSAQIMLTVEYNHSATPAVYMCNHDGCRGTLNSVGSVDFHSSCISDCYSGYIVFTHGDSLELVATAVVPFSIANTADLFLPFNLSDSNLTCPGFELMLRNYTRQPSKESSVIPVVFHQENVYGSKCYVMHTKARVYGPYLTRMQGYSHSM